MVTVNSITAVIKWLAPVFWQRAGPGLYHAVTFLPVLLLAFILPSCASVDVLMLSGERYTPQTSHVEILEQAPTRPYVQIAVLSVDSWWLSLDSKREKILAKAVTLGADAVVFGDPLLSSPFLGNRTAGESAPPVSQPPMENEKLIPDDLRSSMQEGMPAGDVRVFLVHGGGHGGGRGGGHGHGGHWGSPSGHSGFKHGGHFHRPAFFGYGLYGPGWWGYGPNWGGYYPYGSYPYPGYGYMNTVTFGTAIHYTD